MWLLPPGPLLPLCAPSHPVPWVPQKGWSGLAFERFRGCLVGQPAEATASCSIIGLPLSSGPNAPSRALRGVGGGGIRGGKGLCPAERGDPFCAFFLICEWAPGKAAPGLWRGDEMAAASPSTDAHGHSPCRPFSSHLPVQPALERASCALLQTPSPRHFLRCPALVAWLPRALSACGRAGPQVPPSPI